MRMRPEIFVLLLFVACSSPDPMEQSVWTEQERQLLITGLEDSRDELLDEISGLTPEQWNYRSDSQTWPVGWVVEHLDLQENMHFREIYAISQSPVVEEFVGTTRKNDSLIIGYATDPVKGKAGWYAQPKGRWATKEACIGQFLKTRSVMIDFVKTTDIDLRSHFTFRNSLPDDDYRKVRDLHQLVLTTVAHTRRHTAQIRRMKEGKGFPE